ncbi:conidial pigment biosynthesis oxidase Arb2/brown2 [Xylogone sp. PMI_703]|nr:conidial pigment biosynthesis oxidase Arb2/brown2 [Xylogone sp. PMI_703]
MRSLRAALLLPFLASWVYARQRNFVLDLTWKIGAPDGAERYMIFVNGQSPGPTIEVDQGDSVEVLVRNHLPFSTTLHSHGVEQKGTPWSDGVPGLSQQLIPSGESFVYKWTATQYGTFWYHGHSKGQVMDGFQGAIYIRPAPGTATPFDLISKDRSQQNKMEKAFNNPTMMTITDWSHFTSQEIRDVAVSANIDTICMDSILINGKGAVNCQDPKFIQTLIPPPIVPLLNGLPYTDKGCLPLESDVAQTNTTHNLELVPSTMFKVCTATHSQNELIKVDPSEGWVNLNWISTSSVDELTVSIDGHSMWVYAVDGLFVKPQQVQAMTFPHGVRLSTLIKLDQTPGDYTIRVASSGLNQKVSGFGSISYMNGHHKSVNVKPFIDYAGVNTTADVTFFNGALASPFKPDPPSKTVDATHFLALNRVTDAYVWSLNGSSFGPPLERVKPLLFDPKSALPNLAIASNNGTWVDLILTLTGLQPSHPIHKHSNKAYLIGQGVGLFNYSSVAEAITEIPEAFNLENPPVVDTFYTPPTLNTGSWLVIRYHVVNPGAFFLHCHINPHLEGGMGIALLDGIDKWPKIPREYAFNPNRVIQP